MNFDNEVWKFEKDRLEKVLEQIGRKLETDKELAGKLRSEVVSIQKSVWENVNSTSGSDFNDLTNILLFQREIEREGSKARL